MTAELEILNPVAIAKDEQTQTERFAPAPRLKSFEGKTIGLFWNGKHHGGTALERVKVQLGERYPSLKFRDYYGEIGSSVRHATTPQLDRMAAECDAVIGTSAD